MFRAVHCPLRREPMLRIECPTCTATYDVPAESLGTTGRKVRCSACHTLWLAEAPVAEPAAELVQELDVRPPVGSIEAPVAERPVPAPAPAKPRHRPWHERISARAKAPRARWPYAAAVACVLILGGLVGLRKSIVQHLPESGRIYAALGLPVNLTGLDIRQVRSGIFAEGGTELLVVQGEITNITAATRTLPRLKFSIRDAKGVEIYTWTAQADGKDLKPGESQTFRRRLASPPPEGAEVLVRFAGKADLIALAK